MPAGSEQFADVWRGGAKTLATAYAAGALALGGADGAALYACEPEDIQQQALGADARQRVTHADSASVQREVEYLVGCATHKPGTDKGAQYWRESDVDVASVMPVAVAALDWAADLAYDAGEVWAVHGGKVWQATGDASYCTDAPGTKAGGKCWSATPWRPTDIGKARPGLDLGAGKGQAPPAEKRYTPGGRPKARWVAHPANQLAPQNGEWLPYSLGDVAKAGGEWWRCGPAPDLTSGKQALQSGDTREAAAQRCRTTAPSAASPAAKAAWTKVGAAERTELASSAGAKREVKVADLPERGERQQQALAFAPTKADYAEGAEVAWPLPTNSTPYASAWRCAAAACAKATEPTAAGGWKQLRARAEVVTQAPATVEAHAHEEGRPYYAGDKVVVGGEAGKLGGRAYECAKAGTPQASKATLCGQYVPGRPVPAGETSPWARLPGAAAKSKGQEVRKEVDVIGLEALLACGVDRCALRAGQAFAYGGAVLECAVAEKACATALKALATEFAADAAAAAAEPTWSTKAVRVPAYTDAAGKARPATTKQAKVPAYPPRKDLESELRAKLLTGGSAAFKVKAGAKPKPEASGSAGKGWGGVDTKDPQALVKAGKAVACAQSALPGGQADGKGTGQAKMPGKAAGAQEAWRWLAGDLYCDAVSGKAWRCKSGVACGAAVDPTWPTEAEAAALRKAGAKSSDGKVDYGTAKDAAAALKLLEGVHEAKLKTAAYADAWEPVEGAAEKLFVRLEDTQAA